MDTETAHKAYTSASEKVDNQQAGNENLPRVTTAWSDPSASVPTDATVSKAYSATASNNGGKPGPAVPLLERKPRRGTLLNGEGRPSASIVTTSNPSSINNNSNSNTTDDLLKKSDPVLTEPPNSVKNDDDAPGSPIGPLPSHPSGGFLSSSPSNGTTGQLSTSPSNGRISITTSVSGGSNNEFSLSIQGPAGATGSLRRSPTGGNSRATAPMSPLAYETNNDDEDDDVVVEPASISRKSVKDPVAVASGQGRRRPSVFSFFNKKNEEESTANSSNSYLTDDENNTTLGGNGSNSIQAHHSLPRPRLSVPSTPTDSPSRRRASFFFTNSSSANGSANNTISGPISVSGPTNVTMNSQNINRMNLIPLSQAQAAQGSIASSEMPSSPLSPTPPNMHGLNPAMMQMAALAFKQQLEQEKLHPRRSETGSPSNSLPRTSVAHGRPSLHINTNSDKHDEIPSQSQSKPAPPPPQPGVTNVKVEKLADKINHKLSERRQKVDTLEIHLKRLEESYEAYKTDSERRLEEEKSARLKLEERVKELEGRIETLSSM